MANYVIGILSSVSAILILGLIAFALNVLVFRRRHGNARRFLGLGTFDDHVDVLVSSISVKEFTDVNGSTHRVRADVVDYQELAEVYRLTSYLRGPRHSKWLDGLFAAVGIGGRQMETDFDVKPAPDSDHHLGTSTILVGSEAFNPIVRSIHKDRSVARIVRTEQRHDRVALSDAFGSTFHVLLPPDRDQSPYEGREIVNPRNLLERRELALVQKIVRRDGGRARTTVILAGFGAGGTVAATRFISGHWDKIHLMDRVYPNGFDIVLAWWSPNTYYVPEDHQIEVLHPPTWPHSAHEVNHRSDLQGPSAFTKILEESGTSFARALTPRVFLGYDGVISAMSPDSDAALPVPGVVDTLKDLAELGVDVVIISSREISYLRAHLGAISSVELVGNRGLSSEQEGHRREHPNVQYWREKVVHASRQFNDLLRQIDAEGEAQAQPMDASLALHYRRFPQRESDTKLFAEQLATEHGFRLGHGRMVVELYPPIDDVNKGTAVASRLAGCDWAMFAGDSALDVPGFNVLAAHDGPDCPSYPVGVRSLETTDEIFERCTAVVDGPIQMLAYLELLLQYRRRWSDTQR